MSREHRDDRASFQIQVAHTNDYKLISTVLKDKMLSLEIYKKQTNKKMNVCLGHWYVIKEAFLLFCLIFSNGKD